MSCDFIKSLTEEQKAKLRKDLDEETKAKQPKYSVRYKLWDNGEIRSLQEYLGDQLHGLDLGWYENGEPAWKEEYQNGKRIKRDL